MVRRGAFERKKNSVPAVEFVSEDSCYCRVVPREENLSSGRVYSKGDELQGYGGGQPEGLPGDAGCHYRQRAHVELEFILKPSEERGHEKTHRIHDHDVTIMLGGRWKLCT